MVVGEHGIQTFKVVVVVLFVFVPTSAYPLSFLDKQFVQIYFNVSSLHPNLFENSCGTTIYFQNKGHFAYCPIVHN
jgi:hypothetical protein